jgi:hypothetical protein
MRTVALHRWNGFPAIAAIVAVSSLGQGRVEGLGAERRFVSEKYRFSMGVPPGWHVSLARDTPLYVNFDQEQGRSPLHLPKKGAVIVVVAQEKLPNPNRLGNTPGDWARVDAQGISSGNPSIKPLEMPNASKVSQAVLSSYDIATFGPDDQAQHCEALFWKFEDKLLAAHMTYVAHDPNGPALEKLFVETVRSIRPLKEASKPRA